MEMVFVKPASGGRVRQPERLYTVMPPEGGFVPRNSHYERLLLSGDVVLADAPASAPAPASATAPASAAAAADAVTADEQQAEPSKSSTSAGSRKSSRASEE